VQPRVADRPCRSPEWNVGAARGALGAVDQAAEHARAELDGEPGERHYPPGYYAAFFFDPDHIKIEVVHRPRPFSLSFARGLVRGSGSIANQLRRRRAG
jgi:hypothetical protein